MNKTPAPSPGDYSMISFSQTKHTHHPVDDAKGNAEALLRLKSEFGLKIRLN
jgi:hypothetical protein